MHAYIHTYIQRERETEREREGERERSMIYNVYIPVTKRHALTWIYRCNQVHIFIHTHMRTFTYVGLFVCIDL